MEEAFVIVALAPLGVGFGRSYILHLGVGFSPPYNLLQI